MIKNQTDGIEVLVDFAIRNHERVHVRHRTDCINHGLCIQRFNRGVGDNENFLVADVRLKKFGISQQFGTDVDGVRPTREIYANGLH